MENKLVFGLFCLASTFCVIYCHSLVNPFTEEELTVLANVRMSDLPLRLQIELSRRYKSGDNTHWCCKINTTIAVKMETKTRIESYTEKIGVKIQVGEQSCGFLNTQKCHQEELRYSTRVKTHIVSDLVPRIDACPDSKIICCKDFVEVAHNCLHLASATMYLDTLKELANSGLLVG